MVDHVGQVGHRLVAFVEECAERGGGRGVRGVDGVDGSLPTGGSQWNVRNCRALCGGRLQSSSVDSLWKFFGNPVGIFGFQLGHHHHLVARLDGWRVRTFRCDEGPSAEPGGFVGDEHIVRNIVLVPEIFEMECQQPQRDEQQDGRPDRNSSGAPHGRRGRAVGSISRDSIEAN